MVPGPFPAGAGRPAGGEGVRRPAGHRRVEPLLHVPPACRRAHRRGSTRREAPGAAPRPGRAGVFGARPRVGARLRDRAVRAGDRAGAAAAGRRGREDPRRPGLPRLPSSAPRVPRPGPVHRAARAARGDLRPGEHPRRRQRGPVRGPRAGPRRDRRVPGVAELAAEPVRPAQRPSAFGDGGSVARPAGRVLPGVRRAAGRLARQGAQLAQITDGSELRGLARRGSLSVVSAGASAVFNFLLVIVVTRGVDKDEAGVFFSVTSLFLLVETVARLGTTTGLVYFIARFRALDERGKIRACLRVALTPVVVASAAAAVLLLVFAPQAAEVLVRGDPGHTAAFLRVLAVFLPVAAVYDALVAATRGYKNIKVTAYFENIGRPLTQLLLVGLVVVAGASALLAPAWVVPYLPAGVLAWLWLRRLLREDDPPAPERSPAPGRPEKAGLAGEFWRFTAPRTLANIAQMALQRLDIVLVGALRGPAEAAIYAAATRFLVVGQLGNQAIAFVIQPRLSELLARHDMAETGAVYRISTGWLVTIAWPLYLVSAALAPLILLVFGEGYSGGTVVMVILSLAMLVATGCGMVDTVLVMAGRTTWHLGNVLLALAVNVTLDFLLIPDYGVLGAAVAWAVAIAVNNLLPLAEVLLGLRLHPFGAGMFTAAALAGVCFGLLPLLVRLVAGDTLPILGGAIGVGAALYVAGLWAFRGVLNLAALGRVRRGAT
ncbi:MAG: oligosaccharide flippase family protein [Streptosporangiales bacterium]|nr:oligosaccharide flippase family protein [Streptosporangiales bacterium]